MIPVVGETSTANHVAGQAQPDHSRAHQAPEDQAPVVLLHGVGLDHTVWDAVTEGLSDRAVALDLPGHGTQPPLTHEVSLADLAQDVMNRMPEGPVHLVGFSLGSLIAQHIAAHHPQRVLTLTCVSSVCDRTPEEAAAVLQRLDVARTDFEESMERAVERWFPAQIEGNERRREQTRTVLLANDRESYLHAYRVFATGDREVAGDLSRIQAPTLAITGELDPGSTPEMSYRLERAISHCTVRILPGVRHMLPVEAPQELIDSLTTLIQGGTHHD